jgi:hypothetical protein
MYMISVCTVAKLPQEIGQNQFLEVPGDWHKMWSWGFMHGLENKGHVVVMDNYFSSIDLFEELANKVKYATGTMRANRIGVLHSFQDKKHSTVGSKGKWNGSCMTVVVCLLYYGKIRHRFSYFPQVQCL